MKIALITDAWQPQVNGVVTTLVELVCEVTLAGHTVEVIHPGLFKTRPCPGYPGIDLVVRPGKRLEQHLEAFQADAIHSATEGPLGWAARAYCLKKKLAFTTAFHTKFPEILNSALKVPLSWGYALFKQFHKPSSGVLVPTQGVQQMLAGRGFGNLRAWTHGVDLSLFPFHDQPLDLPQWRDLPRPLSLFVGRISYEKNIEAFLKLDIPGTKMVCGVGPLEDNLKAKYPRAVWLGVLPRPELARIYAAADVFVMSSKSETFGLVMLEAMSSGTPVAGFPVDGPLEIFGAQDHAANGGALENDLEHAWHKARQIPRHIARQRAMQFSWQQASAQFLGHLVPANAGATLPP